jgi:hypothetical protein
VAHTASAVTLHATVVPHTQPVHGVHVGLAPVAKVPAAHAVQVAANDAPTTELYEPAAQARHAVDPTSVTYVPAAQATQVAAPAAEYCPALQLRHDSTVPPGSEE